MTKRTIKSRKTTVMHEKTGEVRKAIVHSDGTKHFDLGCASVPVRDESWAEQPRGDAFQFWCTFAAWMIAAITITFIEVYW